MSAPEKCALDVLVKAHVEQIYPQLPSGKIADRLIKTMGLSDCHHPALTHRNHWSEVDIWIISYGDSVSSNNEKPLRTLARFLSSELEPLINGIHILPFYPHSSDDGFSVIDYGQVDKRLGDWSDIAAIAQNYKLMSDLVLNHCSVKNCWFENFKQQKEPGKNYFITVPKDTDVSKVIRPRTSPLLSKVETVNGTQWVWSTFSEDQVDLNYANPDVLVEILRIIKDYLDKGTKIIRLDAVAFLWKELGTSCMHLSQTHEVVRLIRTLVEHYSPDAIIITETNVPYHENLSYFGNANEAHGVYNFPLPPLILHALICGTSKHLKAWQMSMPPAQTGTFYLNFIASHDGIGLRPVEDLLSEEDIATLVQHIENFGGKVSWRSDSEMNTKPYELNIALFDAFKGCCDGIDEWQIDRFLCAHAIMLSLEGIPALYIHSMIATENDYEGLNRHKHNRAINRYKWNYEQLKHVLDDELSHHAQVYTKMTHLLALRIKQPAFHPNAAQYTLHVCDEVFAFWRQSKNRDQCIFCLHNVSNKTVIITLASLNLIALNTWVDLITGDVVDDSDDTLSLAPYQFIWLTNKLFDSQI
ncbi:MAG TPA: alpha-amylase [Gammaproteobacteria bacterium]|nr:alpha-amylase [Gammaproteobacteria bacterium]